MNLSEFIASKIMEIHDHPELATYDSVEVFSEIRDNVDYQLEYLGANE